MPNYNLGSVEGEVRINYDGSGVRSAESDVDRLLGQMTREEFIVRIGADIARVRSDLDTARAELARLEALEPTVQTRVEINAARANIDQLEAELRRLEAQAPEVRPEVDTNQAESQMEGFKTRMLAAGAATGAGFAAALSGALDIEAGSANLQAQLGLTAQEADRAGKLAGDLYANNFGGSMDEVNQSLIGIQNNIGDLGSFSDAELTGMSQAALGLASTFDVDVNEATRAAGQLMKTGLAANATEAFDIIATGFQNGANASGDLLETINEYSTQFDKLGINGGTAMAYLSQGLQAGARDGDLVADAFKEFSIRAVDGSAEAAASFQALGFNADEMRAKFAQGGPVAQEAFGQVIEALKGTQGQANAAEIAFGLFGTQSEDLGAALYALDPAAAAAAGSAANMQGSMQGINDVTGATAAANISMAQRGIEQFTTSLVGMDGPMGTVAAGIASLGPEMITAGAGVAQLAFVAGPAIVGIIARLGALAISGAVTAATSIASWIMMAGAAVVNAAIIAAAWLAANPIALIAIAIAAIVALVIANWDHIVNFLSGVWEWIKSTASAAWDGLRQIVDSALAAIGAIIGKVVEIFTAPFRAAWALITGDTQGAWDIINSATGGGLEGVRNLITNVINGVVGFFQDAWANVTRIAGEAWANIVNAVSTGVSNVLGFMASLPGRILAAVGNLGNLLWNAGQSIVQGLWNGIVGMGNWLYNQIMGWIRRVVPGPILSFLGIASPSKWMRDEVGKMVPAGIAVGMEAGETGLIRQAQQMTDALSGAVVGGVNVPSGLGSYVASTASTDSGIPVAQMAAVGAATASTNTTRTIQIGGLTVQVAGNFDPTDPVRWRQALEELRDGILTVERSYA